MSKAALLEAAGEAWQNGDKAPMSKTAVTNDGQQQQKRPDKGYSITQIDPNRHIRGATPTGL